MSKITSASQTHCFLFVYFLHTQYYTVTNNAYLYHQIEKKIRKKELKIHYQPLMLSKEVIDQAINK